MCYDKGDYNRHEGNTIESHHERPKSRYAFLSWLLPLIGLVISFTGASLDKVLGGRNGLGIVVSVVSVPVSITVGSILTIWFFINAKKYSNATNAWNHAVFGLIVNLLIIGGMLLLYFILVMGFKSLK